MAKGKQMPGDIGEDKASRIRAAHTGAADPSPREEEARKQASLRRISVFKLRPNEAQPPERHEESNVVELKESIEALGLLQPPLISQRADGTYVILAGHRRTRACQLLALEGGMDERIPAYVHSGLSAQDELDFVVAELFHRKEDYSAVALAEIVGRTFSARATVLGKDPTIREMADLIPDAGKTSLAEYLVIYNALNDPGLGPLVRQADKAGKSLLYNTLKHESKRAQEALEAYVRGGTPAMRKILKRRGGRSEETVLRRRRKNGYDLTIRYRDTMTAEAAEVALDAIRQVESELRARIAISEGGAAA